MNQLSINPEFKSLIPSLTPEEYRQLEEKAYFNFIDYIPNDAIEFENNYFACRNGNIYSTAFKKKTGIIKLKPRPNEKGYMRIDVWGKTKYIHKIIAKCFIPNPNNYDEINHKNLDKSDNSADNLQWCTHQYNQKHAFDNGAITYKHLSDIGKIASNNRWHNKN